MSYKYGEPNDYGDFPYMYAHGLSEEQFRELLLERLPKSYSMQIVDPIELEILKEITNKGIDAHLEACTMTKEATVQDRKLSDGRIFQRYCDLGYTPSGMICLIRRLGTFNPSAELIAEARKVFKADDLRESHGDTLEERLAYRLFESAHNLRSCILETLSIERDV